MWQSCHRVTLLFDFICSHQPTAQAARQAFHCLPITKTCSLPASDSTPEQDMQGKKDQGKSHWPQKARRKEDYQGGVSANVSSANTKAWNRGWQRVLLPAVCLTSLSPHNIPDQPRLADIPIMPLIKHPPAVQGTQVIWGTPLRPFSPWQ